MSPDQSRSPDSAPDALTTSAATALATPARTALATSAPAAPATPAPADASYVVDGPVGSGRLKEPSTGDSTGADLEPLPDVKLPPGDPTDATRTPR